MNTLLDILGLDEGLFAFCCIIVFVLFVIGVHYLIASATRSKAILEELKKLNGEKIENGNKS